MQESLQNKSEEYIKKNRKKSIWKRVVQILACVVVFCTTYALILPAITMEQKTFCGLEEHVHTQKCYREIPVASELICPLVEGEAVEDALVSVSDGDATEETIAPHIHTESCYAVPEVAALTCELEENEAHTHDFLCYGKWELVCTEEEHTHSLACFSDPEADVENEATWENMVLNMDLTGYRVEDVVTIAKNQLGYMESTRNYKVNEDTTVDGYTRYGAWGENPYGDWSTLFVAFCLHYAEVEGMPVGADAGSWVQELLQANQYRLATLHQPQAGDLLFVDEDGDAVADHVGIVSEMVPATEESVAQIKSIQGDVANQVQYVSYEMGDARILGYGIIPKQPDPTRTYRYADAMLEVDVELPEGTRVPKNALLKVTAIEESSEKYAELLSQAQAAVTDTVVKAQFYDISFYTASQEYIPVSEKATVVMRFREDVVDPNANTVVLHYDENDSAPVVLEEVNVEPSIASNGSVEENNMVVTYETEGFSLFGVLETYNNVATDELVTGLDGEIVMIVAVNNTDNGADRESSDFYWARTLALSSTIAYNNQGNIDGLRNTQVDINQNITDNDNNLLWEFEKGTKEGSYYIRVANIYGETVNPNAGKYIYFQGGDILLGDESQKQEFEVVKGQHSDPQEFIQVVCLRTTVNEQTHYIQLGENRSGWNTFNSAHFQDAQDKEHTGYPGNHYILITLSNTDSEWPLVNQFNTLLDQVPGSEQEYIDLTEPAGSTFEQQVENRKRIVELVKQALTLYKANEESLTSTQKNFIGEKRLAKIQALKGELSWILHEKPHIVENTIELDATVKLFNYDNTVNSNALATRGDDKFTFYDYTDRHFDENGNLINPSDENKKTQDGIGDFAGEYTIPDMNSQLVDGYPYINATTEGGNDGGSLKYLFEDGQYLKGTMEKGGGLFQMDEDGYYYYYSDKNAAWYNHNTQKFELYDVAVYPEFTREKYDKDEWDEQETHGNFYPFNHIITEGEEGFNVIYDGNEIGSHLDNYEKISTETAFLNEKVDLWFGMSIEYDFFIPEGRKVETPNQEKKDMIFEFHGDDDVFVYIDDVLVLDLGGTHTAQDGKINFTSGKVTWTETVIREEVRDGNTYYSKEYVPQETTLAELFATSGANTGITGDTLSDYTMHNLKFYYLERGGTYSYAGIKFNMPALPEDALLVRKELTTDKQYIDAGLEYQFKIVQADGTAVSNDSFFKNNTEFELRGAGATDGDKGYISADGSFTLKAGQVAVFNNAKLSAIDSGKGFVVQEILPNWTKDQYDVKYDTNVSDTISLVSPPSGGTTHGVIGDNSENGYTTYQTDVYSVDENASNYVQIVTVYNDISNKDLDMLTLTKEAGGGANIDSNTSFNMEVWVGKDENSLILLPEGTEYDVHNGESFVETREVGNNGIIPLKVNETATIKGFLAGTYWKVVETNTNGYTPAYSVSIDNAEEEAGNTGYFEVNKQIDFTVTNYQKADMYTGFNLVKRILGGTGNGQDSFRFKIQQGEWNEDTNEWASNGVEQEVTVTVGNGTTDVWSWQSVDLLNNVVGSTVYLRLSEVEEEGTYIYDDTFYIIKFVATQGQVDIKNATIWKNGNESYSGISGDNNGLLFQNRKLTTVTIDKSLPGYEGKFPFEMTVQLEGQSFTDIPEGSGYTVDSNGTVKFELGDTNSVTIPIPVGATVTVTETDNKDCITSYRIGEGASHEGTIANVQNITSPTDIHFTNRVAYELPATGGSGTHGFIWCGLLMILAAGVLLFYRGRAKRNN